MRRFLDTSLRTQLLLLIVAVLLPVALIAAYTGVKHRELAKENARQTAAQLAQYVSGSQERLVEGGQQLLIGLAQIPQVQPGSNDACNRLLADLLAQYTFYANLGVTDENGDAYCSAVPLTQPLNLADRSWFQLAMETKDFVVGEYQISRAANRATINFAYPILGDSEEVRAVVVAALDLVWLNQVAADLELPPGAVVTFFDRNGTVLSRYPKDEEALGGIMAESEAVLPAVGELSKGFIEVPSSNDGSPQLLIYQSLSSQVPGIYVSVGLPAAAAFAEADRLLLWDFSFLAIVSVVVLLLAWRYVGQAVLQKTDALLATAQKITAGDLGAKTGLPYGPGELNRLARAIDTMSTSLKRRTNERNKAEEAVVESELLHRTLISEMLNGFALHEIICDEAGRPSDYRFLSVNRAFEKMTGLRGHDIIGKRVLEILPEIEPAWIHSYGSVALTGSPAQFENYSKELDKHFDVLAFRPRVGQFATIFTDITVRKQTEQALRESESRLQAILDHSPALISIKDLEGNVILANRNFEILDGPPLSEFVGKNVFDLFPREIADELWQNDLAALAAGRPVEAEEKVAHKDGVFHTYLTIKFPLYRDDEQPFGICAISTDISDRVQAKKEQEKLVEELQIKNAEMERFAYTISHDLRSPLITIQGFVGILEQDIRDSNEERIMSDLAHIRNASIHMGDLLRDLLELSRIGRIINPPRITSLDQLVCEALEMLAPILNENNVEVQVSSDLPTVSVDRPRMFEVIMNLIDNAVKYMGDQAQPRIEIGGVEEDGGDVYTLFVRDNGIGIDPPYHEKIFGLFERLESSAEGTGVGLAIVKRIVEVHGGKVWVESDGKNQGSAFFFSIPKQPLNDIPA